MSIHPQIAISLGIDRYLLRNGRRLCTYRRLKHLFEGETPVSYLKLDDDQ